MTAQHIHGPWTQSPRQRPSRQTLTLVYGLRSPPHCLLNSNFSATEKHLGLPTPLSPIHPLPRSGESAPEPRDFPQINPRIRASRVSPGAWRRRRTPAGGRGSARRRCHSSRRGRSGGTLRWGGRMECPKALLAVAASALLPATVEAGMDARGIGRWTFRSCSGAGENCLSPKNFWPRHCPYESMNCGSVANLWSPTFTMARIQF